MALHLVAFPHTRVSPEFCGCAYTAKVLKFAKMMGARHDVVVYAPEGSDVEGAELVTVLREEERIELFGPDDPNRLPAWPTDDEWRLFNARTIAALLERARPREDLVLLAAGLSQKVIADALPHLLAAEPFVGYEGIFTGRCAFESYAWMHFLYGKWGIGDGRWFDTVIPNFFDPEEFPHLNQGDGDYLLFLGRLISRKGPHVAAQIANELDLPLLVAGAGAVHHEPGVILAEDVKIEGPKVEYVGPVGVEERAKLMAGARALIAPTIYVEPFGGVAVEAQMAGTPVIAPDFGAFTETIFDGVSGFRFRTLAEGVEAAAHAAELDPARIRDWALSRYSLEAVAPQFERWFRQLDLLWDEGWAKMPEKVAA